MRCRAILLLVFALAGSARLAMAMNDPPYCLFPYVPDATDESPLYYTKVCPVEKTEEGDAEYDAPVGRGLEMAVAASDESIGLRIAQSNLPRFGFRGRFPKAR